MSPPREVNKQMASMPRAEAPSARLSFIKTPLNRWPKIFCRKTLEARKRVMVTEVKRKQLAQVD